MNALLDHELVVLQRLASKARSALSRAVWREAMHRRMIGIGGILRTLQRAVRGPKVTRSRVEGGWLISTEQICVTTVVVVVETRTPARTIDDLAALLVVRIHRLEQIDVAILQRLTAQGRITVVMAETQ